MKRDYSRHISMHKLPPVEEAKELFEAAKDWGLWRWLLEKRKARQTADAAWAAFDEYENQVKASCSDDVRKAWREAETEAAAAADGRAKRAHEKAKAEAKRIDAELKAKVRVLQEADSQALKARMDAEAQFDEADRRLSSDMACEGAQMAIDAWLMREKFIRKMEALSRVAH
jgi:hypothetical protein